MFYTRMGEVCAGGIPWVAMTDLTPREIVKALDRHIVGQSEAKRAVAVAVRNRWRRRKLAPELAREVIPRNIVMVGPTGVGKTEVARRLATLVQAPFIKVEATKFTEVGYVGRDVESMIRDLVEIAIRMVRQEQSEEVRERAVIAAKDRLVAILLGDTSSPSDEETPEDAPDDGYRERLRQRLRDKLDQGIFDDREVEIVIREKPTIPMMGGAHDQSDPTMGSMGSMLESILPEKTHRRKVRVTRALEILIEQETEPLIDQERLMEHAIERAEQDGVVFIDEIDKIAVSDSRQGGDVSRQGVQRDLLPIVEGSSVSTKHGVVKTDGMLFIAAGAFHGVRVSDLMPELQGRFPIRVELEALTAEDFTRILTEPEGSLTEQQRRLLETEGMHIQFTDDAIHAMAELAARANETLENIGARRLMTVIEQIFEKVAFEAPELVAQGETDLVIDEAFVRERLAPVMENEDLGRFVL